MLCGPTLLLNGIRVIKTRISSTRRLGHCKLPPRLTSVADTVVLLCGCQFALLDEWVLSLYKAMTRPLASRGRLHAILTSSSSPEEAPMKHLLAFLANALLLS